MTTLTKEFIVEKLIASDRWLYRGLLAIFDYQTQDEQASESTNKNNGVGFNGVDAPILSSFSKQLKARGFLTPKQLAVARKAMVKYAGQLLGIAKLKAAA
jgi:hypothetical protein